MYEWFHDVGAHVTDVVAALPSFLARVVGRTVRLAGAKEVSLPKRLREFE